MLLNKFLRPQSLGISNLNQSLPCALFLPKSQPLFKHRFAHWHTADAVTASAQPDLTHSTAVLKSDTTAHQDDLSHAAITKGIASFASLNMSAPFDAIKLLFDHLAAEPHLAARLNATYPKRGVYKSAGLYKPKADQKVTVDLSAVRLELLDRRSPETAYELGPELREAVAFFKRVEAELVPQIMKATSAAAGFDMASLHTQRNNNYRMIDYFPKSATVGAPRCGVHRDYGTFSIIFQNGASGGLEYLPPGSTQWVSVPKLDAAIVWGWSSAILSGDRIHAARHRVQATQAGSRRQSAVLFVAPNLEAILSPRAGSAIGINNALVNGRITVEQFKNISGKQWRKREGNEEGPADADDVEVFVRSK